MPRESDVPTSVERADPLVGTIFDKRFHVDERIAAGGFGAIYRATHVKSGHQIALKVLLPALARDLGVVARFRREGDTLTALRNPHTITAYELGQAADKTLFIVLELLHGESLFERYKADGPFEWKRVIKIALEVCESLEEAHGMGIVHRDLKPTNIHLEQKGDDPDYVKVLDFGIAKILGGGGFEAADLTNAGQMIGTIDYMSPEQMVGGTVTGQSDIYTLGIVMYEMIAGTTPFGESLTAAQALAAVMKTKPEPLYLRAPVPEELDRIVMRCLERETNRRYAVVGELHRDLARLMEGVAHTRAQLIETKPIRYDDDSTQLTPPPRMSDGRRSDWGIAESTTLVPPPAQLVAATRRTKRRTDDEATQLTPPPDQLIVESRRSQRRTDDDATQFTPPPAQLLAESRRRLVPAADYEATQLTPVPERLLAEARGIDWSDDDDEHAPTTSRKPRSSEEHERVTAVARLADIVERAAMTRAPAGAPAIERTATVPRDTPTPPLEAATTAFPRPPDSSSGARGKSGTLPPPAPPLPPRKQPTAPPALPGIPRTLTPAQQASLPAVPRTFTPSQSPPAPGLQRVHTPQTPIPQLVAAPFSAPPPPTVEPYMPIVAPVAPPATAPAPPKSFDMGRIAAREALIRRLIWIAALIVATGIGVILAMQLA